MKPKEIQELLEFIASSGLEEVNIETEQLKIQTKKSINVVSTTVNAAPVSYAPAPVASAPAPSAAPATAPVVAVPVVSAPVSDNYITIKSPMIGTFYKSTGPEADPFVNIGDGISKGQTVCIIEAMKLFNEIESEINGKIVKILVENASPVEYDQPLFIVDPS